MMMMALYLPGDGSSHKMDPAAGTAHTHMIVMALYLPDEVHGGLVVGWLGRVAGHDLVLDGRREQRVGVVRGRLGIGKGG